MGLTYTNASTQKQAYIETVFTEKDFTGTPTRLEIKAKIDEWLNRKSWESQSILDTLKAESGGQTNTVISLKEGQPASLMGEVINE